MTVERPLDRVLAHALLLRQALVNLITNALKFYIPGKASEVRIASETRLGGKVRLWVEDRGIGITKGD